MAIIRKPVTISKSNSTYELAASKTMLIDPVEGTFTYAVSEAMGVKNNRIEINGDIIRPGGDGGVGAFGLSTDVVLGKNADIRGGFGVSMTGDKGMLTNGGRISASSYAVDFTAAEGKLINNGTIDGQTAVHLNADDTKITNGAKGRIFGDSKGIDIDPTLFDAANLESVSITNKGVLYGGQQAILGAHADIRVINTGRIYGDVSLGEGNDLFDTARGSFLGEVSGGSGNDAYVVSSAATKIIEMMGGGDDTVRASVDYSLSENVANVENLVLVVYDPRCHHGTTLRRRRSRHPRLSSPRNKRRRRMPTFATPLQDFVSLR